MVQPGSGGYTPPLKTTAWEAMGGGDERDPLCKKKKQRDAMKPH